MQKGALDLGADGMMSARTIPGQCVLCDEPGLVVADSKPALCFEHAQVVLVGLRFRGLVGRIGRATVRETRQVEHCLFCGGETDYVDRVCVVCFGYMRAGLDLLLQLAQRGPLVAEGGHKVTVLWGLSVVEFVMFVLGIALLIFGVVYAVGG